MLDRWYLSETKQLLVQNSIHWPCQDSHLSQPTDRAAHVSDPPHFFLILFPAFFPLYVLKSTWGLLPSFAIHTSLYFTFVLSVFLVLSLYLARALFISRTSAPEAVSSLSGIPEINISVLDWWLDCALTAKYNGAIHIHTAPVTTSKSQEMDLLSHALRHNSQLRKTVYSSQKNSQKQRKQEPWKFITIRLWIIVHVSAQFMCSVTKDLHITKKNLFKT